jgi:hypothetical protein
MNKKTGLLNLLSGTIELIKKDIDYFVTGGDLIKQLYEYYYGNDYDSEQFDVLLYQYVRLE